MINPCILIAPGPYKECLTAFQVAEAMQLGVKEILPHANIMVRPLCDGGSGIATVLTQVTGGRIEKTKVKGPTGEIIESYFGILGDGKTAIIESASAAGLSLIPTTLRNPLLTSTYGVGELINQSLEYGVDKIIIGCGDSGTNDCGIGCASALGVKFFCEGETEPLTFPVGADLSRIRRIDFEESAKRLANIDITVACNLSSILCGPSGTSRIYGPQKGANAEQVEVLHQGVSQLVDLIFKETNLDLSFVPGAGGAGGLASALYAFFGGRLLYSIEVVDRYVDLDGYLSMADLVLTGEGRIDDQTATGKVACGVGLKAKKYGLPVVAIVGSIGHDHEDIFYNGIDAVESIADGPITLEESMNRAAILVEYATTRAMRFLFKLSRSQQ